MHGPLNAKLIGSYIISENTLVKKRNIEQFINPMSEILHSKCKQYDIPYCEYWTCHVHVLECLPDYGYL